MKSKQILAVNRYFFPDDSATSRFLTDLAPALVAEGWSVRVLASRRQLERPEVLLKGRDSLAGVQIRRIWSTNWGRRALVARAVDYLTFYFALVVVMFGEIRRGSLVIAMTDPPMLGTVVSFIASLKQARVIHWHQDLYPEVAARLGVLSPQSWLYKGLLRARNWALRRARANVVLGDLMANHVQTAEPRASRVTLIPNWFEDMPPPRPEGAANSYRQRLGIGPNGVVVSYAGNFGRAHDFDALVQAAVALRDRKDLSFLMIGSGARYEPLRQQVAEAGLPGWHFLPYQPREQAPEFLAAGDIHLIFLDPRVEGLIVPSKLYGIMAAGRPVVFCGAPDSEVATLLRKHDCGIAVSNAAELTAAMRRLADEPQLRVKLGNNARAAFDREYARRSALERWSVLVSGLATDGAADPAPRLKETA